MNPRIIKGNSDSTDYKIGIVVAEWYPEITNELLKGALKVLEDRGFEEEQVVVAYCPGSYEIPHTARQLLKKVDGIVTLGVVIRGETTHYDYVCEAVNNGIAELNMSGRQPVSFGVLTTENRQQARVRCGMEGSKGNKGEEATLALLKMLALGDIIKQL